MQFLLNSKAILVLPCFLVELIQGDYRLFSFREEEVRRYLMESASKTSKTNGQHGRSNGRRLAAATKNGPDEHRPALKREREREKKEKRKTIEEKVNPSGAVKDDSSTRGRGQLAKKRGSVPGPPGHRPLSSLLSRAPSSCVCSCFQSCKSCFTGRVPPRRRL